MDLYGNWTVSRHSLPDHNSEGFGRVRPLFGHGEDLMSHSSKFPTGGFHRLGRRSLVLASLRPLLGLPWRTLR